MTSQRTLRFALALTLTILCCPAQEILKPFATRDLHLGVSPSSQQIASFASNRDNFSVLLLSAGVVPARLAGARLIAEHGGARKEHNVPYAGQSFAASSDWVFLAAPAPNSPAHLINSASGLTTPIRTIDGVARGAVDPEGTRLAVVGPASSGSQVNSRMAVYDTGTLELIGSVERPIFPAFCDIWFTNSRELLLIEPGTFRVTPMSIGSKTLSPGSPLTLTGPEVDDSKRRYTGGDLPANSRPRYLLGYFPGRNGTHFFFLGPNKSADGMRLVEFGRDGAQVRSFRLHAEAASAYSSVFTRRPLLLSVSEVSFDIVGQDGIVRSYRRPQRTGFAVNSQPLACSFCCRACLRSAATTGSL